MKGTTIKDIAKIANVSHTTVSRALNDSPLIKEETKKRIREIAQQLNYSPNYSAKSLVLSRSFNIGLFFSTLEQGTTASFFHEVVKEVSRVVKDPYNLIVMGIDDLKDFGALNKKRFDGIIVMSQSRKDNPFIYHVLEKEIPIVVLNREMEGIETPNILSDEREGAYRAAEHMIRRGHRRIAAIEGEPSFQSTRVRREGFVQALHDHGLLVEPDLVVSGDYSFQSGFDAMKELLKRKPKPSAVFCFNDDMAIGAIKAIAEADFRVPEDISIIGFDDNVFSQYAQPALTTVRRPVGLVGRKGAEKLLQLIGGESVALKDKHIATELVVRDSVAEVGK